MKRLDLFTFPRFSELGVLTALAVLGYAQIFSSYFLAEDFLLIGAVVDRHSRPDWSLWIEHLHSPQYIQTYRPIVTLAYTVQYWLWGIAPAGFHATSVFVHFLNALCLFLLVARLDPNASRIAPFLAAALFVTHPLHPEAVTYIAALNGPLCTFFYLSALLLYLYSLDERRSAWLVLSVLSFVLALGSKEEAVTLPFAVALLTLMSKGWPPSRVRIREATPGVLLYFVVLAAYFGYRRYLFGHFTTGFYAGAEVSLRGLLEGAASYFACLLAPVNQDYLGSMGKTVFVVLLCLSLGTLAILAYRRRPRPGMLMFSGAMLAILLVPFFKVLMFGIDPGLTNSRYLYLPSAAFVAGVALVAAGQEQTPKRMDFIVTALFLALQLTLLHLNNRAWADAAVQLRYIQQETVRLTGNNSHTEIVNLPDTAHGVLFNRGGFQHALVEPFVVGNTINRRERVMSLTIGEQRGSTSDGFAWDVIGSDTAKQLRVKFAPKEAKRYAADSIAPSCGERTLRLRGRGTNIPPFATYLAARITPEQLAGQPPLAFMAFVSDLEDGLPAEEVGFSLEPGVPWRLRYFALDADEREGPENVPTTIPDGGRRRFRLELTPAGTPTEALVVPRIAGVNTPIVMTIPGETTMDVSTVAAMGMPSTARMGPLVRHGEIAVPPCEIDFGTVPLAWYRPRADRPFIHYGEEPAQLFWDDETGRLMSWTKVEQAKKLVRATPSEIARWQHTPSLSFLLVSPFISALRSEATGQFFHTTEIDLAPTDVSYLVVRMRAANAPLPFARLWWKRHAEDPDDFVNSATLLIVPDGYWHTYAIPLHARRAWRTMERIRYLRFEPIMSTGFVEIERFEIIGQIP